MPQHYELQRNAKGDPVHVFIDNGFMQESRPYKPDIDGWMEDQLDPMDFPMIRHGRDMEYLLNLVNKLKRKNFELENTVERYRKMAGFGD